MYEFKFNFNISFYGPIIMLILIVAFTIYLLNNSKILKLKIIITILAVFMFCLVFESLMHNVTMYQIIKKEIEDNKILYVEGKVEELYTLPQKGDNHDSESFIINGIKFEYNERTPYGYSKLAVNDGLINENGQNLKIGYYEEYDYYDKSSPSKRVIVSIEILEDK